MSISNIKAYTNAQNGNIVPMRKQKDENLTLNKQTNADKSLTASEKLISRKERDYFKKLFPENSVQIEKHELFTRNGKLQSTNISKGSIVDWTV